MSPPPAFGHQVVVTRLQYLLRDASPPDLFVLTGAGVLAAWRAGALASSFPTCS